MRDLLSVLAAEYPTHRAAASMWKRAGGLGHQVHENSRIMDLWQDVWTSTHAGTGVTPVALLREALKELPRNTVLLRYLQKEASRRDTELAQQLIALLEASDSIPDITELQDWVPSSDQAIAAICPAMDGRVPTERRGEMMRLLKGEVTAGALLGLVKAGVAEAVKEALLFALEYA